jgi:hypothetical protein
MKHVAFWGSSLIYALPVAKNTGALFRKPVMLQTIDDRIQAR